LSRAQRLLELIQLLRGHRLAVPGAVLAVELGISLRTLYRDVETLKAQGANIEGEAGVGYLLRPGFMLPPLMFSDEEIEALVLGSRWVADRADGPLAKAASQLLAKIGAVLPEELKNSIDASGLLIGPAAPVATGKTALAAIRKAIQSERKLQIDYENEQGNSSKRIIWPIALVFYDRVRVLVAWCELREGFRHFRADRIVALEDSKIRYPRRRTIMLQEWRRSLDIPQW
jgi:predicted DNA-binding transcriptional regulator YafY